MAAAYPYPGHPSSYTCSACSFTPVSHWLSSEANEDTKMTDDQRQPAAVGRRQVARNAPRKAFPTWEHLKHLRRSQVVRSMHVWLVIVPIMAKLLAQIGKIPAIELFGTKLEPKFDLPFSWQLFYFSALAFSAGNLIFLVRCPRIVKEHANPSEFHEAGKGLDQIVHYAVDAGLSSTQIQDEIVRVNAEIQSTTKRYNRLFWIFYDHANYHGLGGLWFATFFYIAGLTMIVIVLTQNFLAVVQLIL